MDYNVLIAGLLSDTMSCA